MVISYAARDIGERLDAKACGSPVLRYRAAISVASYSAAAAGLHRVPEVRSQLAMTWGTETFIASRRCSPPMA